MAPLSPDGRAPLAPSRRDPRIDAFRGLALVTIFINHVPGTVYEQFTSRNFGFSDAAEAFVFMSGMAAGLAYSRPWVTQGWPAASLRIWARARQLYFVHIAITVMAIGLVAAGALFLDKIGLLGHNNMGTLLGAPLAAMIGLPLLTFQIGYLNILPLYILLLLATPLFLALAWRAPLVLLGASVALWAIAGATGVTLRTYPGGGGWFFNPFAWQLLFVIGLVCGVRMAQGRALVPYRPALFWTAAAFVVAIALWMKTPQIGVAGRGLLGVFSTLGAPDFLVWFNKNTLALPRLLHALALFYVLSSIPALAIWCAGRTALPLRLLGRHALAVFATGTVVAIGFQVLKWGQEPEPLRDGLLLATGLGAQLLLAYGLETVRGRRSAHAPVSNAQAEPQAAPAQ